MKKIISLSIIIVIIFQSILVVNNVKVIKSKGENIQEELHKLTNRAIITTNHGQSLSRETLKKLQLKPSTEKPEEYTYVRSLSTWWNDSWEYRINVTITEPKIADRFDWPVDIYVKFNPPAFKYSVRVIEVGVTLTEIPYQLWNITYYNSSHISAATVTFLVDIPMGGIKKYQIYWSVDYVDPPAYNKKVMVIEESVPEGTAYIIESTTTGFKVKFYPTNGGRAMNISLPNGETIGHNWIHFGVTRNPSYKYNEYWGTGNTNNRRYVKRYILEETDPLLKTYEGVIFVTYVVEDVPLYDNVIQDDCANVTYMYRIFPSYIIVTEKVKWRLDETRASYYLAGWVFDQDDGVGSTFNYVYTPDGITNMSTATYPALTGSINTSWNLWTIVDTTYTGLPVIQVFRIYLTAGSHTINIYTYGDDYYSGSWANDDPYGRVMDPDGNWLPLTAIRGSSIDNGYAVWGDGGYYSEGVAFSFNAPKDGYYFIFVGAVDDDNEEGSFTANMDFRVVVDGKTKFYGTVYTGHITVENDLSYVIPRTAISVFDFTPSPDVLNIQHDITVDWTPTDHDLDVVVFNPNGGIVNYSIAAGGPPETVSFTPTTEHYTTLVIRYDGTGTSNLAIDITCHAGAEYEDFYGSNAAWDRVLFVHDTESRAVGFVLLEQDLTSITYATRNLTWYNEGNDSEIDYIYWALLLKDVIASASASIYVTCAVYPWSPTETTLQERINKFENFYSQITNKLSVTLADVERYKIRAIIDVRDEDNSPIPNAEVAFVNATGSIEYTAYTNKSGIAEIDVIRKSYTIKVTLTTANITYVNDSVTKDYSTFNYIIHSDTTLIKFKNLVKIKIKAYTNTIPRQIVQDGDVYLNNSQVVIHGRTNLTGWFETYVQIGQWTLRFNATKTVSEDYDNITVYYDPDLQYDAGTGRKIDLCINQGSTYYLVDNDIKSPPHTTMLRLHNTPTGFSVYWKENITINVNMTLKNSSTGEVMMWNGTLHWYILDPSGNCVLHGDVNPCGNGTFTFEINTSQISAGVTYTILINATPNYAKPGVLKPSPLYISLDVKKRPLDVDITFEPSNIIFWNESLTVHVYVRDGLTPETAIIGANVYMEIYGPEKTITLTFNDLRNGEYRNVSTHIPLDVGSYTAIIHIEKNNYVVINKAYTIVIKERPTYCVAPTYVEIPWTERYNLEIKYIDERYDLPITDAYAEYNLTDATIGATLLSGTLTYKDDKYVATLNLTDISEGTYIICIFMGKKNYENMTYTLTFVVRARRTLAEPDTTRLSVIYGERIIVRVSYYDEDFGKYIAGASTTYTITAVGVETTPITGTLNDLNNGTYVLNISSEIIGMLGSFIIKISLSKKYYESKTVSITLVIDPIPTDADATATTVSTEWGIPIDVNISYITREGIKVTNANATFVIKYSGAIIYRENLTEIEAGLYRLYLNSSIIVNDTNYVFGTYTVYVYLGKRFHENQTIVITWTIEQIIAYCNPRELPLEIEWGMNITITYELWYYRNEKEYPILGATAILEVIEKDKVIYKVSLIELGNGKYLLNLNTTMFINESHPRLGAYTLKIIFTRKYFKTFEAFVSLTVNPISTVNPTPIPPNATLYWGEDINITIEWRRLRDYVKIVNAIANITVLVEGTPITIPADAVTITEFDGTYILHVDSSKLEDNIMYEILVQFEKPFYESKTCSIYITVEPIPATAVLSTTELKVTWGDDANVSLTIIDTYGEGVSGVEIIISDAIPSNSISVIEIGEGNYTIFVRSGLLTAGTNYTLYLEFRKEHYNIPPRRLLIVVKKVQVKVEIETSTTVWKSISPFDYGKATSKLTIRVFELPTNIPVNVTGSVLINNETIGWINETVMTSPGTYEISISWDRIEPGTYELKIRILVLKRGKYVGSWDIIVAPVIYINGARSDTLSTIVNVDFVSGHERIFGVAIPKIYFWSLIGLLLIGVGAGFVKFIMWWRLPVEVKELIKIIKDVKKGMYEYKVPPRREILIELIKKELGIE